MTGTLPLVYSAPHAKTIHTGARMAKISDRTRRSAVSGVSRTVWCVSVLVALLAGVYIGNVLTVTVLHAPKQAEGIPPEVQRDIARWQEKTRENPRDAGAWNNLAFLYHDTHQHEAAIRAYEESLKLVPDAPDILVDLGVMYRAVSQPQKAVACFDRALRQNPAHQIGLLNKGVVLYFDLKDAAGARAAWQELLRINPKAALPDGTPVATLLQRM